MKNVLEYRNMQDKNIFISTFVMGAEVKIYRIDNQHLDNYLDIGYQ